MAEDESLLSYVQRGELSDVSDSLFAVLLPLHRYLFVFSSRCNKQWRDDGSLSYTRLQRPLCMKLQSA